MADGAMLVHITRNKNWLDDDGKFKELPSTADKTSDAISGSGYLTDIYMPDSAKVDEDLKGLRPADAIGDNAENWHGIIFTPYGGCVGGDTPLLFFFTEAKINGDSYEYPNEDNFLVLKLNPITGKVVYLAMEDDEEEADDGE